MNLQQHPLSAAFPAMSPEDFQALTDSIENIGVQNPITLFEGMVIDGWHRYRVAAGLGMGCPTVDLGDVDPRDFVLAQNKARRNLTASQRADAVTAVYQWVASNVGRPRGEVTSPLAKTNAELAAIAGTTTRTIQQAKAVRAGAVPAVQEAVKTGAVSVETAAAVAKLTAKEQKKIAAKGPDAMRAAAKPEPKAKPEPVISEQVPAQPPEPAYTDLDAARDQISELQADLVVARMGDISEEEKQQAAGLIAELHAHIKTLEATNKALVLSRDALMEERAQMLRQMKAQRAEIDRLKSGK